MGAGDPTQAGSDEATAPCVDAAATQRRGPAASAGEPGHADAALSLTEGRERALLENFPFAVWLKDTESRFLAVNGEFARLFGYARADELVGRNDFDIVARDLAERYRADDRKVLASQEKLCREEQLESAGRREWFETYKAPVFGADGRLLGTVGFARNIERRRQVEERLRLAASVFTHARESIMMLSGNGTIN